MLNDVQKHILEIVADMKGIPDGAVNIRSDGKKAFRQNSKNIEITSKTDKDGIDIRIAPFTKSENVHIPVILSKSGFHDLVYNDFFVGEGADVTIVAGCGIHNCGDQKAQHDGIHTFYLARGARVRYVEKHYADGDGSGERVLNPVTVVRLEDDSYMEMETTQIGGVDSTIRRTEATLGDRATLIIREKIMTAGKQTAETHFTVDLDGVGSGTHVISRSVARDSSHQLFCSQINGNNACTGHTECDAILMDHGSVSAVPEISANHVDASLIHEAAIGKIAGEQLVKLMTLGLTEKEAEEQIIAGFMK